MIRTANYNACQRIGLNVSKRSKIIISESLLTTLKEREQRFLRLLGQWQILSRAKKSNQQFKLGLSNIPWYIITFTFIIAKNLRYVNITEL